MIRTEYGNITLGIVGGKIICEPDHALLIGYFVLFRARQA
jgi:hypothetical protein